MAKDYDANPLHSKEESPFTTALLDFFEAQAEAASRSRKEAAIVHENRGSMTIEGKDAENINRVLEGAMRYGARYVSFDPGKDGQPFRAESMVFFTDKSDAGQHNYMKRVADQEHLQALPVAALQQQLGRSIELQQHTKGAGQELAHITIDTGRLFTQEHARQEIFTHEISRELKEQHIIAHTKQLQDNIQKDRLEFQIMGMRSEQGIDKPYVITIAQNENRAFQVQRVEERVPGEQIKGYNYSNTLEGSVRSEDAPGIKNFLQQERDNGNRFVSFPAAKAGLSKEDFTAFRSAFSAQEHAYENTTDRDMHILRSISVVEREVSNILENKKEQHKPQENEREEKRSRGQGLER